MIDEWTGCYDDNWKGVICDEAFAHPAKFSHGLIRRIYQHLLEDGLLKPGDTVVDPLGGVGLGGLFAADAGLSWIGVELERDFAVLAHRNFAKWAKERWCTCGCEGDAYLCSMRQSFSERTRGDKPDEAAKDGAVLQPGLPQQIPLFGEEIKPGPSGETKGPDALEQGPALGPRDAPKNINSGLERQSGDGEEWTLEGGQVCQAGWVHRNSGERQGKNGAHSLDGNAFGAADESGRGCSSQEREQAGQPARQPGSDDGIGTYEITSPERDSQEAERKDLRDLRPDIPSQPFGYLQPGVQAATESRVLAKARRETEGKFCQTCGKLIVPFPIMLQGDSRKLVELVRGAAVVTSPPYAESFNGQADKQTREEREAKAGKKLGGGQINHARDYGTTPGQLGALKAGEFGAVVSSPPYADSVNQSAQANDTEARIERMKAAGIDVTNRANVGGKNGVARQAQVYGNESGQLGAMKEGPFNAVVTSPPFAGNSGGRGEASRNGIDAALFDRHSGGMVGGMGDDPANLGNLRGVVTSPPYADSINGGEGPGARYDFKTHGPGNAIKQTCDAAYGSADGQMGAQSGETFWQAARAIVEQCALILPSGAPAVWVVKDFVKSGQRVEFSQQWAALCEACGFRVIHIHRALLVKDNGTALTLDGGAVTKTVARKSFFRRLAESRQVAVKHWQTLDRSRQARELWSAHGLLWAIYHSKSAADSEEAPQPPNRSRILREAQSSAWDRDSKPAYEIETAIDYETVLCTVRM